VLWDNIDGRSRDGFPSYILAIEEEKNAVHILFRILQVTMAQSKALA
jgi:hypothetical protein